MSFSGCIGTIFSLVAKKMCLEFDKMQVDVEAEKKDNAPTITDINCIVTIKSQESEGKIKKCLEHTLKTCPVGLIFEQAGINITHEIKKQ